MKKIMLLMLLSASSTIFSQHTGTGNIPEAQIPEIYKGLKQADYLKVRLQKTETTLNSANALIEEQEKALSASKNLLSSKDQIIATKDEVLQQEKAAASERENQLKADVSLLQNNYKILEIDFKNKQRKKFWNGVKIGGVSVVVLGAVGVLLIK